VNSSVANFSVDHKIACPKPAESIKLREILGKFYGMVSETTVVWT
jgi:hypothetical protein